MTVARDSSLPHPLHLLVVSVDSSGIEPEGRLLPVALIETPGAHVNNFQEVFRWHVELIRLS